MSFAVEPGLVTGFLGPNGAGKSTTMKMIMGLVAPTRGTSRWSPACASVGAMAEMTDEEIRAAIIGDLTPYAVKVVVVDYDPVWPAWFAEQRDQITAALGERALSIEHTGSTSVPGLAAKPIIDMLLQVTDSGREGDYLPDLERAGFELRVREPDWLEHRCLRKRTEAGATRDVNLHVFSPGIADEEIDRILSFRNWLRANPADRDRYAAVKRELARLDWKYVQNYADAKTDVIEEIIARAKR